MYIAIVKMVKNAGGNKSKRQGRKHINTPQQRNVRYIKEKAKSIPLLRNYWEAATVR